MGPDLQFLLVVTSIYDFLLTFLFPVGAEGPAYLRKPEEFSLQLCLIEGGLLLLPDVKSISINSKVRLSAENINCRKTVLLLRVNMNFHRKKLLRTVARRVLYRCVL